MTPERWRELERVFHRALDVPRGQRGAWVRGACGGDASLADAALALVRDHERAAGFLEPPTAGHTTPVGGSVGAYRIVRAISLDAAGAVYEAARESNGGRVSLRVVTLSTGDVTRASEQWRRVEEDIRRLAGAPHANIAATRETGLASVDGRAVAYIASELVDGGRSITAYAEEERLSFRERVALAVEACAAVGHAHGLGLAHGMLGPCTLVVDARGRVKVMDFCVARAIASAGARPRGAMAYLSPERCADCDADARPPGDVYALGAVVYELIAGRPAFDVAGLVAPIAANVVREQPPPRITGVRAPALADLEAVVHKALEKDPARRYATATELAADLRRYARCESVHARPAGALDRAVLYVRRLAGPRRQQPESNRNR